jgi:hypothetical protein
MDHGRIVELLLQNAAIIREDLALLAAGTIKLTVFGTDVSQDHAGRLKANLDRLEAVLDAYDQIDGGGSTRSVQ